MKPNAFDLFSDAVTKWMGSTSCIILHTVFFLGALLAPTLFAVEFEQVLLVLTTVVSLEAIYLSLFIQRSVNQQGLRLEEVEETLDEVEESIDDVEESIDGMEKQLDGVEESIDGMEKTLDDVEESIDDVEKALDEVEEGLDDVEEALAKQKKPVAKPTP